MNFSRVQWTVDVADGKYAKRTGTDGKPLPEDNWVWAATGLIDIHYPETWAYVFFTENGESCPMPEEEKIKLEMYKIYYAQHEYCRRFGCFAKRRRKRRPAFRRGSHTMRMLRKNNR